MKTKLLILNVLFSLFMQAQIINIPDNNFKNALLNMHAVIDTNGDNEIQIAEANNYSYPLYLSGHRISDLTGIEYFINTPKIICGFNYLTTIDISANININTLACEGNQLTSLDTSQNVNLQYIDCSYNNITTLDLANNNVLYYLDCNYNYITQLNLINNNVLSYLDCGYNNLTSLVVPNNIFEVYCRGNDFVSLDFSNHTNLMYLFCSENYNLLDINITGCTNLVQFNMSYTHVSNLNIESNTNLVSLEITQNELTSLDLSNTPNLRYLFCGINQISTINVSQNLFLLELGIGSNNLSTLDVSNNLYLNQLWCQSNNLSTLDVSNNSNLVNLNAYGATLTSLDVRNGNNNNFTYFNANCPNLNCIYVDDAQYSQDNWSIHTNSTFVETEAECEALSINNNTVDNEFVIYPNPIKNMLNIKSNNSFMVKEITIFNMLGEKIMKTTNSKIDFSAFNNGIYLIKIKTNNNKIILKKVIKE